MASCWHETVDLDTGRCSDCGAMVETRKAPMIKPTITVPYTAKHQRFFEEHRHRETIRVQIEPQKHEVSIDPGDLYRKDSPLPPQQMMETAMIELLRGQAVVAAMTVLRAGILALRPGGGVTDDQLRDSLDIAAQESHRRLAAAETERDQWKKLAEKRKVEIETLERVLRR